MLIGVVVGRNGTLVGDGGGLCVVFHLDSVDCAAPRAGDLPASGTYSAGAGSPASNARVGDRAGVCSGFITAACRRLVQWLRFRRSVRSRATDRRRKPRSVPFRHFSPTCTGRVCPSRHAAKTVSTNGWSSNPTRPQIHQFLAWAVRRGYPHNVKAPSPKIAEPAERLQVIISDGGRSNT